MDKKRLFETGRLIKEARILKNYTQQELATAAGLSLRSVQRIQNAEVVPRAYTLKTLAAQLDINLEDNLSLRKIHKEKLNRGQRIILSVSLAIILFLLAGSYVLQSSKFPETTFEMFLYVAVFIGVYTSGMLVIWGNLSSKGSINNN